MNLHHAVKGARKQVKQTIVRIQKQIKSTREIAGKLGVAKSTVWNILRKMHWWAQQHKRPGWPQRTTVVDDRRILSVVKKTPFTTSSQEKNTVQGVDVSLSKSTIKRRLHQSKYRGFTTSCTQGQIRLFQKHLKKSDHFWKNILWTAEIEKNLYQNDGKKKAWRRLGTAHDPKHTTSSVTHGGAVWWHELHGFQWHWVTGV